MNFRQFQTNLRLKSLGEGVVLSLLARAIGYLNAVLSVRLALPYLGPNEFGAYATGTSVAAIAVLAELGIGHGLVNVAATKPLQTVNQYLSSSLLVAIVATFGVLLALVPITHGLISHGIVGETTATCCAIAIAAMVATMPVNVFGRVLSGLRSFRALMLPQLLGQVLAFCALLVTIRHQGNAVLLTIALTVPPVIASYAGMIAIALKRVELRPHFATATLESTRYILSVGLAPFFCQAASSIIFSAPIWTISAVSGVAASAEPFAISRITSIVPIASALITQLLWPEYAVMVGRRDWYGVKRLLVRSILLIAGLNLLLLSSITYMFDTFSSLLKLDGYQNVRELYYLCATLSVLMSIRQTANIATLGASSASLSVIGFSLCLGVIACVAIAGQPYISTAGVLGIFIAFEVVLVLTSILDLSRSRMLMRTA